MKKFIHDYLSKHYVLSSNEFSKKIHLFVEYGIYYIDDKNDVKELRYGDDLIKEISAIFGVNKHDAEKYITSWAKSKKKGVKLNWYWGQNEWLSKFTFPVIQNTSVRTISLDLIPVKPMSEPNFGTNILEYVFSGNTPIGVSSRKRKQ